MMNTYSKKIVCSKRINFLLIVLPFFCIAQVGINTTSPTAMFHIKGNTTLPVTGGLTTLLQQNFNSFSVTQSFTPDASCTTTSGWVTSSSAPAGYICSTCTAPYLYIDSDDSGCDQNATSIFNFTPTTTSVNISFGYRFVDFTLSSSDSFRVFLFNNSTNSQVGGNLVSVTTNTNTSYTGTHTLVAGTSYSLRFQYIGSFAFGATVDNVLIQETVSPVAGNFSFRLEDGTQANGKILTSDADGNGYWASTSLVGSDSQTLSLSGNSLSISNGNTVTLPTGSGSNTYTNGLTNTSGTVRLGGVLTQPTTLNLDTRDLTFTSSTTSAFPGQFILQGTNRVIMDTAFESNYINFGSGAFIDADDGTTFLDTGSTSYTKDFVAGFHNGSSGGTSVSMGSIEYFTDGTNELFYEGAGFSPMSDQTSSFGNTLGKSNRRWGAVYATNGVITTSDMRLKTNIAKLKYGLKEIEKLDTFVYNWKNYSLTGVAIPIQDQERKIGLSAQQLLEYIPEVVTEYSYVPSDEKGNYKKIKNEYLGVNYSDIIPVLINAIKELKKEIEDLKIKLEVKK